MSGASKDLADLHAAGELPATRGDLPTTPYNGRAFDVSGEVFDPKNEKTSKRKTSKESKTPKAPRFTKLVSIVNDWKLFRTPNGRVHVELEGAAVAVDGRTFAARLAAEVFARHGEAVQDSTRKSLGLLLEARCERELDAPVRVGRAEDGSWWIDLRGGARFARVGRGEVTLHTMAPCAFVRPHGQGALPKPIVPSNEQAARSALRASLAATGARTNRSAVSLLTWWLGALSPRGPYAHLIIRGSYGSGKTGFGRMAIRMIDPHRPEIQRMPSLEDLPIAIEAAHVWGFDNLSRLDQEHSDALCCLATGDAVLRRSLYTDRELTVFEASRPVLITSITDAATAPDLLDRSLVISLDRLTERKGEDEIFEHWRKCWPSGFGALLWFAAQAMVRAPASEPPAELRMRDIARRAAAVEQAAGFPAGAVYAAFAASREDAIDVSVTDPLVAPLLAVVKAGGGKWEGTADELLADLREQAEQAMRAVKSPRGLVAALARLEPQLAELGLTWARARSAERRELHFQSVRAQAPADRSLAGWMEEDFDAH